MGKPVKKCATGWIDAKQGIVVDGAQYPQDGTGIQAAINALPSTGGVVLLAAGTYTLTSAITVSDSVNIFGSGRHSTILVQSSASSAGLVFSGDFITVADITLRGANSSNSSAKGIDGGSNIECMVRDCTIEQFGSIGINFSNDSLRCIVRNNIIRDGFSEGIYFGTGCADDVITGNLIYNNDDNGIDCLGTRCVISDNVVRNNGTVGPASDNNGIMVGTTGANTASDVVVTGNVCTNNARDGIFVWGAGTSVTRFVITDNVCAANSQRGIRFDGAAGIIFGQHIISGNICQGNTAQNILLDGCDDTAVTGNVLSGGASYGLHFYGTLKTCARNSAVGNIIRSNTSNGVQIDNGNVTDALIGDNAISGNAVQVNFSSGSRNTVVSGRTGSFTVTAAGTSTISDANIPGSSVINIFPTNAAAGLLLRSKSYNVGTVAEGSFTFVISATGAGAPAGTETFGYSY